MVRTAPHIQAFRCSRAPARYTVLIPVAAGLAVALFLLASLPLAGASPPIRTIQRFTAPYTADAAYDHSAEHARSGCGGSFAVPTPPTFNLTTGESQWAISAHAAACANGSYVRAIQYVRSGVTDVNFTVPSSGQYNFTEHWNGTATFSYNLSAGASSSNGTFYAEYVLQAAVCLYDRTAGSGGCSWGAAVAAHAVFTTGNGSGPANGTVHSTYSVVKLLRHSSLIAGHQYYLRGIISGWVQVGDFGGLTTGSASGLLDLTGTHGGAYLVGMRIYQ